MFCFEDSPSAPDKYTTADDTPSQRWLSGEPALQRWPAAEPPLGQRVESRGIPDTDLRRACSSHGPCEIKT